jgi:hypothetical protein
MLTTREKRKTPISRKLSPMKSMLREKNKELGMNE